MRSSLVVLLVAALASSGALAAPGPDLEARAPVPSKRFEARSPAPSKRAVVEARAPQPSKQAVVEARAPQPSKRAPAPQPSKRAPAPQPSKRAPEPAPQPSKRSMLEQVAIYHEDLSAKFCPAPSRACPVGRASKMPESLAEWDGVEFECVDFNEDLKACGGCGSVDASHDCTTIPNALAVACVSGACQVTSCKPGFVPSPFTPGSCVPL
ncbi:hypothetical protein GLOTRDRAFT_134957 [Gloeophyllum trabeum ATCC 11539]|uniref:Protein CPL1-like domain-containing protein n=1 Tax=Gloeophyllum trabeum (strain ATCC 11539 / FP-39264 / Madison 617) TaxID=670483 RepID=S7S337_GLOTA|nr:uncharacterized protein GLOTRDRAFT_134957 [Gloeophyllum trabeum ATCC 11539]EPQ60239.1 hypothetical protein GLOTRDRAFT_134957 [Gloeophyllum trabeum ATCC 11539]